jgi:hypothetical protein
VTDSGAALDERIIALENALETALQVMDIARSIIIDLTGHTRAGNDSSVSYYLHRLAQPSRDVLAASRKSHRAVSE